MILSVSRRTDIPNYYSDWFLRRLREGFLYVRNPRNPRQISKLELSPKVVDGIVFWTKNPANMMGRLEELREYPYYFQFTLTGYGADVEPGLPSKRKELIPTFRRLSERIGKERVIWRYDPIFLSSKYTPEYHLRAFEEIADSLSDYTEKAVISFGDFYAKTKKNTADLGLLEMRETEMRRLAAKLAEIAEKYRLRLETCSEEAELSDLGIMRGSCIDRSLFERMLGCKLRAGKDKNQRKACGCMESIDVGVYNSCRNGCKYCYANFDETRVMQTIAKYRPEAPLLCGEVGQEDILVERKQPSLMDGQLCFWE